VKEVLFLSRAVCYVCWFGFFFCIILSIWKIVSYFFGYIHPRDVKWAKRKAAANPSETPALSVLLPTYGGLTLLDAFGCNGGGSRCPRSRSRCHLVRCRLYSLFLLLALTSTWSLKDAPPYFPYWRPLAVQGLPCSHDGGHVVAAVIRVHQPWVSLS
jgi:hypothetical protein